MVSNKEAKDVIKKAVNNAVNAVKETFGVFGNTVVIPTAFNHIVTKDGVSVLTAINSEDEYENIIINILKESALKTNKAVGDGSTTFSILTQALYNSALKHIENGAKPIDVKRGMEEAVETVLKCLDEMATKISSSKELASIAKISANNDEELGELIGGLFEKIGVQGVTSIEQSPTGKTYTDIIQGMSYEKGWYGSVFATDKARMISEFSNPLILICDYAITSLNEVVQALNYAVTSAKPILIICDEMDYNTQSTIIDNMKYSGLKAVVTRAPYYGEKRLAFLQDIALYTEANIYSKSLNKLLENFDPEDLGDAEKVIVSGTQTLIVKTNENPELEEVAKGIEAQEQDDFTKARLANLRGKLGIIYVGADTDVEFKEKYDRVEDALNATKASLQEGYVLGGGNALLKISKSLQGKIYSKNEDENSGFNSVVKAIQEPFKTILLNAGQEAQHPISLVDKTTKNKGYSVREQKVKDLFEDGIIDPVKVTKHALKNACSVACQLLTTNVIIK